MLTNFFQKNWYMTKPLASLLLLMVFTLWSNGVNGQCSLACNDNINLSVDGDCEATVTVDMILEGYEGIDCDGPFVVEIQYLDGTPIPTSPSVGATEVGQTFIVMVSDPTGNSCWGNLTVEDKIDPIIVCPDDAEIFCTEGTEPSYPADYPTVTGAPCCSITAGDFTYEDGPSTPPNDACEESFVRTWTFTSCNGNTATCEQTIIRTRPGVADVTFPDDVTLECGDASDPEDLSEADDFPNVNGEDIDYLKCNLGSSYVDQTIELCTGSRKILRTWTVADWCTGEIVEEPQIIKILDSESPTITCPDDMTVSTEQNSCTATVSLPQPASLNDACSTAGYTVTVSAGNLVVLGAAAYVVTDLPEGGPHTVTYTADDGCGNTSECTMEITVEDGTPPIAICDEYTNVSLGVDGTGRVFAESFDDGSHDNCNDVHFKVRRMNTAECDRLNGDDATQGGYQEWFDDYADFCCDDIGSNVMVILRVYDVYPGDGPIAENRHNEGGDLYGRYNECMVEVEVEDKLEPIIVCPPDITISCEFPTDDLSVFGTVVTDADDREEIIIDDAGNTAIAQPNVWGIDGYAYDNCSLTITEVSNQNIECGEGLITRSFTATDAGGRTASCVQRIYVVNYNPFDEDDIVWPIDKEADCSQGIDTDATGEPGIIEDDCDNVFVGHDDLTLPVEFPFCYKILRTWIVIDWCQFSPNVPNSPGRWEHTQVIKVLDTTAPTVTAPADVTILSTEDNCSSGPVTLDPAIGSDDCDANVTITNDQNSGGEDASGTYPYGTTTVVFTAEDACGNVSTDEMTITVLDGKAPTPVCQQIATTVMPSSGEITIWATDFEADGSSFDNCTAFEDLEFRIRRTGQFDPPNNTIPSVSQTTVTFGCADLGTQWVDMWVIDEAGNADHCRTFIEIQDPTGACDPDPTAGLIAGRIATEMEEEVSGVMVGFDGYNDFETGTDGTYEFSNVEMHNNYTVNPQKDDNPLNGVSTFDLVLIRKHILGITPFDSPYKIIAADINNSESVTTFDLVELQQTILGINTTFTNNTSWRFVDKNFVFPNEANPFQTSFPEVISFNDLEESEMAADFVAVKIGDVNDSAIPSGLVGTENRTTAGQLLFDVKDQQLKAGQEYTIDFAAQSDVLGYQFTIAFDNNLEFVAVAKGDAANFGLTNLDNGVITTSWNAVGLPKGTKSTFSLTFRATQDIQLSDALTLNSNFLAAEAYSNAEELLEVGIAFNTENGTLVSGSTFELYQNRPNPVLNESVIGFNLREAGAATLTIYDVSGKVLKQIASNYAKGYNEITISKAQLEGAGVVYYQLDTATETATKKMIIIQ